MTDLPPEPGTVPDLTLGVEGDFGDAPEEPNSPAEVEINDEEEVDEDG